MIALLFMQISIAAGTCGFVKAIPTGMDQGG